jgi:hypothetical protein
VLLRKEQPNFSLFPDGFDLDFDFDTVDTFDIFDIVVIIFDEDFVLDFFNEDDDERLFWRRFCD